MKFSFNKTPTKQEIKDDNDEDEDEDIDIDIKITTQISKLECFQLRRSDVDDENDGIKDPCTKFQQQYKIAIDFAEKGDFAQSLRSFDLAIRFWCCYLDNLKKKYPNQYKKFNFPDINNCCDVSNYFLNLHKNGGNQRKIKKKLWKPPPKHQPKSNQDPMKDQLNKSQINGNNDNDNNSNDIKETDNKETMDCDKEENKEKDNSMISEWKKSLLNHRKIGSEMFESHGQVLIEMDRDFEAIKACQSSILLNNLNEMSWLTLSRAELNFGDPFQALKSIEKAIQLNFDNQEIIEQYSTVYSICNKLSKNKFQIKRRYIINNDDNKNNNIVKQHDMKSIKQRLEKRAMTNDMIKPKS